MAWFTDFRERLVNQFVASEPDIHVGVFGKHPGWDDHLDDIGLDTEALILSKQHFYVQGIGGVIDSGVWDNAGEGETIPEFKHLFLWSSGKDLLIGRLWASTDGVGRARYPMIACAHATSISEDEGLPWLSSRLLELEATCRSAEKAEDVRRIVDDCRAVLRNEIANRVPALPFEPEIVARRLGVEAGGQHMGRVAHAIDAYLAPFAAGKVNRRDLGLNLRLPQATLAPQHLRLPAIPDDPLASIRFWRTVLASAIDPAVPFWTAVPCGEGWLDVVFGPLTTNHLRCLKATPRALPLTTDVPFTLSEKSREVATKISKITAPNAPVEK